MSDSPTTALPHGNCPPGDGGLNILLAHFNGLRLSATVEIDTTAGPAILHLSEGSVRAASFRGRAGMTALTAATLLATGDYRLRPLANDAGDQIGLLGPALLNVLRDTSARVRSDLASKGALPNDPLLGVPVPNTDTTTDELLADARLTVRDRSAEDDEPPTGDFPEDFLAGLIPDELRGEAGDEDETTPEWIEPAIGQMLGKCYLTAELGRGGTAIVYRALHLSLKIDVAVKVMLPGEDLRPQPLDLHEARILARLNHPTILRVLDCNDQAPYPHVVMEFVEGSTLAEMIDQNGRLTPATAIGIILNAAEGLAYAAEIGVVHNDVKPANLLISRQHEVKISDLGLARAAFAEDNPLAARAVVGTPAYIAPEIVEGGIGNSSAASDIYSLGCTLYHAITGSPPYVDGDPITLMLRHVRDPVPAPDAAVPGLDGRITALLTAMLAKNPFERPDYPRLLAELGSVRQSLIAAGVVGPGLGRSQVPSVVVTTLSTVWTGVRQAIDTVLGGVPGTRRYTRKP